MRQEWFSRGMIRVDLFARSDTSGRINQWAASVARTVPSCRAHLPSHQISRISEAVLKHESGQVFLEMPFDVEQDYDFESF